MSIIVREYIAMKKIVMLVVLGQILFVMLTPAIAQEKKKIMAPENTKVMAPTAAQKNTNMMGQGLEVLGLSAAKKQCGQPGTQTIKSNGQVKCIVKSDAACRGIGGRVSKVNNKPTCVLGNGVNPAVPGIEGSDIGSG